MALTPQRISEGTIAFMFESSRAFTLTDYAMNRSGNKHEHERECLTVVTTGPWLTLIYCSLAKMWEPLRAQFIERLDDVNRDLRAAGLPEIKAKNVSSEVQQSRQ